MRTTIPRAALAALTATLLGAALVACSKDDPVRPRATRSAVEDPHVVVQRYLRAWNQRDTTALDSCLALPFTHVFGCVDSTSAISIFQGPPRDSTLLAAARLFQTGFAGRPPASSIVAVLESLEVLQDAQDPRLRDVFAKAVVTVRSIPDTLHLGGFVGLALYRGDGPGVLSVPDSTRWLIVSSTEIWFSGVTLPIPIPVATVSRLLRSSRSAAARTLSPNAWASECDSASTTIWSYALRRYLE